MKLIQVTAPVLRRARLSEAQWIAGYVEGLTLPALRRVKGRA
jgi:hypothetical protein